MSQFANFLSVCFLKAEGGGSVVSVYSIQELLDAGLNRNQVASRLNLHHQEVKRLIDKHRLETYTAFDEHVYSVRERSYWCLDDILDGMFREAFYEELTVLPNVSDFEGRRFYKELTERYGSMRQYARMKKLTPLLSFFCRECCCCGELRPISGFYRKRTSVSGYMSRCSTCYDDSRDPDVQIRAMDRRRTMKTGLPVTFVDYGTIGRRCALTGRMKPAVDHFIPLASGHCGSYVGNLVPLSKRLNCSKHADNPFEWFEANGQRFELSQSAFDSLVAKLAEQNGLTPEEFRDFTYWCFANKRTVDQVRADNLRYGYKKPSLEIWREGMGLAFPIRVDFGDLSVDHAQETEATAA